MEEKKKGEKQGEKKRYKLIPQESSDFIFKTNV